MMKLPNYVFELCNALEKEARENPVNREAHYTAAKLLRVFNELFDISWRDVEWAEQMIKDREADAANGHPWNGYESKYRGGKRVGGETVSIVNGVWHDAKLDPPQTNKERDCFGNLCFSERVLTAVRHECKDGTGYTDVWIDQYTKDGKWLCADVPDDDLKSTVLCWMPLPKIPEVEA